MKSIKTIIFIVLTSNSIAHASSNSWSLSDYLPLYFQVNNLYQKYNVIKENKKSLSSNETKSKLLSLKKDSEQLLSKNTLIMDSIQCSGATLLLILMAIPPAGKLLEDRPLLAPESPKRELIVRNHPNGKELAQIRLDENGSIGGHWSTDPEVMEWVNSNFAELEKIKIDDHRIRAKIQNDNLKIIQNYEDHRMFFKYFCIAASGFSLYLFYEIRQYRKLRLLIAEINNDLANLE